MKKTIQTRLDDEDIEMLEKEANEKGYTLSSLIRHIVKKFLQEKCLIGGSYDEALARKDKAKDNANGM